MTLDEMLDLYARHLAALNRAPKTVRQYVQWVRRFFAFARAQGIEVPADITAAHLLAYQRHLAGQLNFRGCGFNVKVQNQHLIGIVMFLRHLHAEGILAHNPAQHVQYAKVPQELPRDILSITEMRKMLRAPDAHTVLGYRDRVILEILYSTGIRRQELLNLTVDDVNLESGLLTIRHGKGGKDRVVPLGKLAAKYLETYLTGVRPTLLQIRALDTKSREKKLFLSMRGLPLSVNALAERVEFYRKAAGIKHAVTPHTFRHSCATHMIRNRANIRHVQEMLGHVNLNTTQQYLHLTITDLKEAHARFHPREKDA